MMSGGMEWGSTDSVVSIPSRARSGSGTGPGPSVAVSPVKPIEEEEDWQDIDEQLQAKTEAGHQQSQNEKKAKRASGGGVPSNATSPTGQSKSNKSRLSGGGSGSAGRSRILPPPPSSGYGTANYNPYLTHSPANAAAQSGSSLYAAYAGAHAATSHPPTRYLGMQAPKTEWLLPTRVSVQERTTHTTVAKSSRKSHKASKSWKGYIPENQAQPFDLRVHHPKVLEAPLAPLPGNKNEKYEGAIQRVPVSEATTRASLEKRAEKKLLRTATPAQLLEEAIESRRLEKRLRFEQETEKAKEQLWHESTGLAEKQIMITEERALVDELRQKVRQARAEREEKWKQEEIRLRQKENLELRIPEARLAKYERWLREEQEREMREKYVKETGQQPPVGYGRQDTTTGAHGEEEEKFEGDDGTGQGMDDSLLSLTSNPSSPPTLPQLPRFPNVAPTIDQGRFVESSYLLHHHSGGAASGSQSGSNPIHIGIEFKMLTESDPEAHAPLFAPTVLLQQHHHQQQSSLSATSPIHGRSGSTGGSTGQGHHPHASYGSIGGLSQLDGLFGSGGGAQGGEDQDEDEHSEEQERKYSHDGAVTLKDRSMTPETSALSRAHLERDRGHGREASHSARGGTVSFALGGGSLGADEDDDTEDVRPSRSTRALGGREDESREASRAREHSRGSGMLRGVREEQETPSGAPSNAGEQAAAGLHVDASSTPQPPPPIIGSLVEWTADEDLLAKGFGAIKIPRSSGLFSKAKQVTLQLSQGTSGKVQGKWLLHWNSKAKKAEEEFVNLTEGMKGFARGLTGATVGDGKAFAKVGKDVVKKYQDRANHCYTLQLSDRTLDLVILDDGASEAFARVLSRISHPSGTHRTPRTPKSGSIGGADALSPSAGASSSAASASPSPAAASPSSATSSSATFAPSQPSAYDVSSRGGSGAGATAHAAVAAHVRATSGLSGGLAPLANSKATGVGAAQVGHNSGALALAMNVPASTPAAAPISTQVTASASPPPASSTTTAASASDSAPRHSHSRSATSAAGVTSAAQPSTTASTTTTATTSGPVAGQAPSNTKQVIEVDNMLFQH